ncbi:VWA domain-containing protein [Alteromonas ponticola]|uniref:VWA domain-containing protein n=1 Tax=Alteromonas aquimaris TaxID=2998417 RepID=A0ABT3P4U9_9ALTE|nr:VWA domain-containing protein [Alteromonas aquimaris]MCW8107779.1 VWA domain-containing protein [Alteromonas aquimaris]
MAIIEQFHFLRPLWFMTLIPLGLLYWLIKQHVSRRSGWQSIVSNHLYRFMVINQGNALSRPPFWLLASGWIIAVVALAGPTWERLPQPVFQVKAGHVIVMDMSLSMRATDLTPDRLTRAKYKAIDLVNAIGEGEMGLVAYAGDAFTISPLTTDAANLTALIPSLRPEIMPVPGSDPFLGIQTASELLANAGYQRGNIYWFTDEIELSQAKELQDYIDKRPYVINVVGTGTPAGAPIKQISGELLKAADGSIVIAKLNESPLRSIAHAGNGVYTTLSTTDSDIKKLLSAVKRPQKKMTEEGNTASDKWREAGPYLVLLLLPLAAYAFRRGLIACFVLVSALSSPDPVFAQPRNAQEPVNTPWYSSPFSNRDQRGLEAFKQEAYDQAASEFISPAWKGAAHYKAGNYQAALEAYSQLNTADGFYNQGNSLARLGKLDEAIEKYAQALAQQPDHADAAHNKALLEELKQQQEQQQQQQQQQNENAEGQQDQPNQQGQQNAQNQQNQQNQQSEETNSASSSQQQDNAAQSSQSDDQQQSKSQQAQSPQPQDNQQRQESETTQPQSAESDGESDNPEEMSDSVATEYSDSLSDEELQRLENIKRRIPDDPAYLLKRKMQLEAQRRQRDRLPANRREW